MDRRTVLTGAGALGIASLAGCLGIAGLDEHASEPATVAESVREETGYEQTAIEEIVVEEEVDLAVMSETVSVTNHLTEHERSIDMGPLGSQRAAMVSVLTTPQVNVAGQEFNPIDEMDTEELVDLVAENYDEMGNVSHEDDDDISILDQSTVQSTFSADARFEGHDIDVYLHATEPVERGDDFLVAIGVYPELVRAEEEENVLALMEAIE